jgi:hypothetical protein
MDNTAQHGVTSHYTAYHFAEAKSIKHILTYLQNKQVRIG